MTDDVRLHHVTVRLDRDYRFTAGFDDVAGAQPVHFDEPEPLGADSAPNAAAMLGAAVGNCLAASLAFCLRRARVDMGGLSAHVTTRVVRNERGRFRIEGIEVELDPEVSAAARGKLERCSDLFEDFCIVTESVRRGIPVTVSMKPAASEAA
jgi:uncharacterized OsmC-like protein